MTEKIKGVEGQKVLDRNPPNREEDPKLHAETQVNAENSDQRPSLSPRQAFKLPSQAGAAHVCVVCSGYGPLTASPQAAKGAIRQQFESGMPRSLGCGYY